MAVGNPGKVVHRSVHVHGVQYHLVEHADTDVSAPLVLLLHGFPESWFSWRHQLQPLAHAGLRAIALDMPGYGQTDVPCDVSRTNQVALSDDVAAIATALGYTHFDVVGHDWGAPTAWYAALRFPERVQRVAALSVPYGGQPPRPPTEGFKRLFAECFFYMQYFQTPGVAEAELEPDVPRFLRSFLFSCCGENPRGFDTRTHPPSATLLEVMADPGRLPAWLSPAEFDFYVAEFERVGLRGPLSYYRNLDTTWQMSRSLAGVPVRQPALFVAGDCDPVPRFGGEFDRMQAAVPQVRCHTLANCGHWTQQERPDEVNALLVDFLAR
ncbi:MAG: alpha/beta hydrolase [Pseudomonadota bacterium]